MDKTSIFNQKVFDRIKKEKEINTFRMLDRIMIVMNYQNIILMRLYYYKKIK